MSFWPVSYGPWHVTSSAWPLPSSSLANLSALGCCSWLKRPWFLHAWAEIWRDPGRDLKSTSPPGSTKWRIARSVSKSRDMYYMGMGQYLLIPFLVGWTSIYQLFWGSLGTRVLTHPHMYWCLRKAREKKKQTPLLLNQQGPAGRLGMAHFDFLLGIEEGSARPEFCIKASCLYNIWCN